MGAGTMALAGLLMVAGALPPDVVPLKDRAIKIPIVLKKPQQVRELRLWVSTDQGRTWRQSAQATPDQQFFPFYAEQDGPYWFQLQIIDQAGKADPADLNQQQPGLTVLVDTQPPILKIVSADRAGDDVAITWQIQEQYPALDTLRLEYRPAGDPVGAWSPVQISPIVAGQVRFRPTTGGPLQVRMSVQDSAGNQAQAVQAVGTSGGTTVANAAPPVMAPAPTSPFKESALPPPPRDVQPAVRNEPIAAAPTGPPPVASSPRPSPTQAPSFDSTSGITPVATNSPSAPVPPRQELRDVQLINSTQVSLEYEVPRVGPSGIRSVKLYLTRDDGRSWEELADDRDLVSPVTANLPGEGTFGFRLVVESGAGLSRGSPMPGDAPEMRVEVDLTPPYIELYSMVADPKDRDTMIVRWNATDKNLAPNPIMLEYSTSKTGPWVPISTQPVPNSGSYPWKLSQRLPYRVYFRVVARDLAGNSGEVVTPEPQLIDLTKPEAHLKGIKSTQVQIIPK